MIKKLKLKFLSVNMIIVTVMLIVIFGLIIFFTASASEKENLQQLRAALSMPPHSDHAEDAPPSLPYQIFVIRQTPRGQLAVSGNGDYKIAEEIFSAAIASGKREGVLKEYNLRFCVMNTPMDKSVSFSDLSVEQAMLFRLVRTCVFISLLALGAFFIVSLILARWIVRPMETAWEQQKQFAADASHELKTPLTVIITNAELLRSNKYGEEKRTRFAESILTMAEQMRGLTESLLELARSDARTEIAFEIVDFSELTADSALPFEPLFFEKGLTLRCETEKGITVKGSRSQLSRLTDILLDNALKYSYPNTEAVLSLKKRGNTCILSMESHGDTISKADLKNIFRRFYRADKVRGMNKSYGLGLSIAENIVKEHGGRIYAESEGGVNRFYVKLGIGG
jgi:signal transduction histidine kinase